MSAEPAAASLLDRPARGRVVERTRRIRLGDVDRLGQLRFDATARYLQDIATDDADDAGLDRRFGWLVRRTLIRVGTPGGLGEELTVATWCTGLGRSWAERRSELRGAKGAVLDAVSLWVQIDVSSGRPAPIAEDFTDAYATASGERRVSARLALPAAPGPTARRRSWTVRSVDLDPFDHVNNAATWSVFEEAFDLTNRVGTAELEYPHPITRRGDHELARDGDDLWLIQEGRAAAVGRWRPG
ncbi:MAG: acyl-ACP thioesterase domain-containing protein [Actinomycetota bacterium]